MLTPDRPRRVVSQAPLKSTTCYAGCGAAVFYRTSTKVICEVCRPAWRAEKARASAESQRRKRGVKQIKGTAINCRRCGVEFIRSGIRRKLCDECVPIDALERANVRARRVRRERGCVPVGTEKSCQHCKMTFAIHVKGRVVYCRACRVLQKTGRLPNLLANRRRYWENVLRPRYSNDPEFQAKTRKQQAQSRERRKQNPSFSINERMSAAIRGCLKGGKSGNSWEHLVGYCLDDLMQHLERQFQFGMSWDNRGEWEIDHVIPLSSFIFSSTDDPEFKRCWSLPNLRPLWRVDNNRKRASRTHLI